MKKNTKYILLAVLGIMAVAIIVYLYKTKKQDDTTSSSNDNNVNEVAQSITTKDIVEDFNLEDYEVDPYDDNFYWY